MKGKVFGATNIVLALLFFFLSTYAGGTQVCALVSQRVAEGILTPEFAKAIQEMLDAGPNRWVKVEGTEIEGLVYQRGVAGTSLLVAPGVKLAPLRGGGEAATQVLLGEPNKELLNTSVLPTLKDSDIYFKEVNTNFAFPLAIRGDARAVGLVKATSPEIDSAALIPPGALKPETIHSMGFFYEFDSRGSDGYKWVSNYLVMMERLKAAGVTPTPNSRGDRFHQDLLQVWRAREWQYSYQPGFGYKELRNQATISSELGAVAAKYERTPEKKKKPKKNDWLRLERSEDVSQD